MSRAYLVRPLWWSGGHAGRRDCNLCADHRCGPFYWLRPWIDDHSRPYEWRCVMRPIGPANAGIGARSRRKPGARRTGSYGGYFKKSKD